MSAINWTRKLLLMISQITWWTYIIESSICNSHVYGKLSRRWRLHCDGSWRKAKIRGEQSAQGITPRITCAAITDTDFQIVFQRFDLSRQVFLRIRTEWQAKKSLSLLACHSLLFLPEDWRRNTILKPISACSEQSCMQGLCDMNIVGDNGQKRVTLCFNRRSWLCLADFD